MTIFDNLQSALDELPSASDDEVLYGVGIGHVMVKTSESDEQKEVSSKLLEAAEAEARKRKVPDEIIDITKAQAEIGKFVVG